MLPAVNGMKKSFIKIYYIPSVFIFYTYSLWK